MEAQTMKQSVNTHTFWQAFYPRQQNRLSSVKRATLLTVQIEVCYNGNITTALVC